MAAATTAAATAIATAATTTSSTSPGAAGPTWYLGGAERPPGGVGPPALAGSPHLATWRLPVARPWRRRLPVSAGQTAAGSKRRPQRPHRGAVTMGRTPSPAPSGSHSRRGGEGGAAGAAILSVAPGLAPAGRHHERGVKTRSASSSLPAPAVVAAMNGACPNLPKAPQLNRHTFNNVSKLSESRVCGLRDSPLLLGDYTTRATVTPREFPPGQ